MRMRKTLHLVFEEPLWPYDAVKDVLSDVRVHSWQGVVQQVDVGVTVHSARKAHSLLLSAADVYPLLSIKPSITIDIRKYFHSYVSFDNAFVTFVAHILSVLLMVITFSPISVWSLPGNMSRSGTRAHASITFWYFFCIKGFPNRMLFISVAFCIHASCGTYAVDP